MTFLHLLMILCMIIKFLQFHTEEHYSDFVHQYVDAVIFSDWWNWASLTCSFCSQSCQWPDASCFFLAPLTLPVFSVVCPNIVIIIFQMRLNISSNTSSCSIVYKICVCEICRSLFIYTDLFTLTWGNKLNSIFCADSAVLHSHQNTKSGKSFGKNGAPCLQQRMDWSCSTDIDAAFSILINHM